jgi:uncharacterized membrane protein YedE/YeeE
MNRISEFAIGLLFGWGLLISGMTDPGKVIGFLDLAGTWDPSLAFVMGGGVLVGLIGFTVAKKRTRSILGSAMHLPTSRDIDRRLVLGSLTFGAGWGLTGFCPGPGIVAMGAGESKAALFVVAMIAGMLVFEVLDRWAKARAIRGAGA